MTTFPSNGSSAAPERATARARSPILITGGDPAGIGPELVHALAPQVHASKRSIVYFSTGGLDEAARAADLLKAEEASLPAVLEALSATASAPSADPARLVVPVVAESARAGKPDERSGAAAFEALKQACDLALDHPCHGIVTAPISKEWISRSGRPDFTGHTGYLADRFGCSVLMLMHGEAVSVIPLTIHLPLMQVGDQLRKVLDDADLPGLLLKLMRQEPFRGRRWALCGLNPHAGEGGVLGTEEQEFLAPLAERWRQMGLPIDGPLPADAAFLAEARDRYRLILGCYHDQVLAPFKALEGRRGINVTVGLPLLRSSPDHGTAYELAGTGKADSLSMRQAFAYVEDAVAET